MLDVAALTADSQQEATLRALLQHRATALGIRPVAFEVFRHPRKDPGVWKEADAFLRAYRSRAEHALVVLDHQWEGAPADPELVRGDLLRRLGGTGWAREACEVIVVVPELEVWVWGSSRAVPDVLRCDLRTIRQIADEHSWWPTSEPKPIAPKELLEAVLRRQRRPRSASIFEELAQRVSVERCTDPSFVLLRETLQRWFAA